MEMVFLLFIVYLVRISPRSIGPDSPFAKEAVIDFAPKRSGGKLRRRLVRRLTGSTFFPEDTFYLQDVSPVKTRRCKIGASMLVPVSLFSISKRRITLDDCAIFKARI